MSWNGSGTFAALTSPTFPAVPNTTIDSAYYNAVINDLVSGINNSLAKDGQNAMTGALDLGSQLIKNIGSGSASAPSLYFGSDSDTGLYSVGANQLGIAAQGALLVTFGASATTFAKKLTTAATASGGAGFNLPHGTAPSSPSNGDLWTTTGGLYARINGSTKGPFTTLTATENTSNHSIVIGSGASGSGNLYNSVFGDSAGAAISGAVDCCIFGHLAGNSLTSGNYSTLFGAKAGKAITSNNGNSAFGYSALVSATGARNAAFGYTAGSNITTGSKNTILGSYTGSAALTKNVALSDGDGSRYFFADGTDSYISHTTTASGANAFLDSSSGAIKRSTSSEKYKRNIEPMEDVKADAILNATPIYYKSAIKGDRQDWAWYGLSAEEMDTIDPRFVQYRPHDDDWTEPDENNERFPIPNARLVPDGVAYDRLVVPLISIVKRLDARISVLEGNLP